MLGLGFQASVKLSEDCGFIKLGLMLFLYMIVSPCFSENLVRRMCWNSFIEFQRTRVRLIGSPPRGIERATSYN